MSTETIALLTILRDETQSRDVLARCDAQIEKIKAQPSLSNGSAEDEFDCAMRSLFGEAIRHTRLRR